MAYTTDVPLVPLVFSDGFKYYGAETALAVSATVNLSVPSATHTATGETLTDGQVLPAQAAADFDVPRIDRQGWRAPNGSTLNGWSYDLAVTITATGQPSLLWTASISPGRNGETITPGLGALTGAPTGDGSVTVTEDPNVPGTAQIGA